MNVSFRALVIIAVGAGMAGLNGCSSGGGATGTEDSSAQSESGLKYFNVCGFFTPAELSAAGVGSQGERVELAPTEPGCGYEGEDMILTLYKNQAQTVASYESSGSWDSYKKINVNGRAAANGIEAGATGRGGCATVMDAGGGVVLVDVTGIMADSIPDPCAKAQEIATKIEPRLPE